MHIYLVKSAQFESTNLRPLWLMTSAAADVISVSSVLLGIS